MAVTGAIFEKLIFGGVDSSQYGIYITGEAVYNAPKRAVEMVSVPGRNGAVAIDQGYWENITVTYPAGTFADGQTDFADAVSAFRNALASQIGYQRLEDTYHPDEYRMAMFVDGVEVTPANRSEAGQFNITFTCKPQRWLKSGETAIAVTDGGTITNPTLYESGPLLAVTGYGNISFSGYDISIISGAQGITDVAEAYDSGKDSGTSREWYYFVRTKTFQLDPNLYNAGDTITIGATTMEAYFLVGGGIDSWTGTPGADGAVTETPNRAPGWIGETVKIAFDEFDVASNLTATKENVYNASIVQSGTTMNVRITARVTYSGNVITLYQLVEVLNLPSSARIIWQRIAFDGAVVDSTLSMRGNPTYIDCDLGEVYKEEGGTVVDLNSYVDLGSDLPVLEPGANTITMDNTITNLEITPRWWQL